MKLNLPLSWRNLCVALLCMVTALTQSSAQLDTSYAPTFSSINFSTLNPNVRTMAITATGKAIISGGFGNVNGGNLYTHRLNANGSSDSLFTLLHNAQLDAAGLRMGMRAISVDVQNRATCSGFYTTANSILVPGNIARFTEPDVRDVAYLILPFTTASNFAPAPWCRQLPDGKALVWGIYETVGSASQQGLSRLTLTGEADASFAAKTTGTGPIGYQVNCAVPQLDGKVIMGGSFTTVHGTARAKLARVTSTGALDATFANPNLDGDVYAIAVQADGKYLVGGVFRNVNGTPRSALARINTDGTLDATFVPTLAANAEVYSIGLRADGKSVVVGSPTLVQLTNDDGSANAHFQTVTLSHSTVSPAYPVATTLQADGKVLIAGVFDTVDSTTRAGLARLEADVAAVQTVEVGNATGTSLRWLRSGSTPEVDNASFSISTNGGTTYTALTGTVARIPGGWELTLPANKPLPAATTFIARARGQTTCGHMNSSTSLMETTAALLRPRPTITTPPATSTSVVLGSIVATTLNVVASSTTPLTYQWQKNGVNIPGATSDSYTLPTPITATSGGTFRVIVTNGAGSTISTNAVVTVILPINITVQPVAKTVGQGKAVTFSVTATGTLPQYEWQKDGNPIPGAANRNTFTITSSQPADEGNYSCRVHNTANSVPSSAVALSVINHPTVAPTPANLLLPLGQVLTTLTANEVSESTPTIAWLKNGIVQPGQTANTLNLANLALTHAGKYQVRVTNLASTVTSPVVELGVVDQTNVITKVAGNNTTVTLTAPTAGNSLSYLWKVTTTSGTSNVTLSSPRVTTSLGGKVLTIKNLTPADSGAYTVEVTGPGGTLTSAAQHVVVTTQKPEIDPALPAALPDAMVGEPYNSGTGFTIPQLDDIVPLNDDNQKRAATFAATGLPIGLKISPAGLISGTPTTPVLVDTPYTVRITASNLHGPSTTVSRSLTLKPVPVDMVGSWAALIERNTGLEDNHGGRLTLTVTTAGGYSGSVTLGSKTYPFTGGDLQVGLLFNNPNSILVKRTGLPSLTLTLNIDRTTSLLTGSITDGVSTANMEGWRNKWKATVPATDYAGRYNAAFTPPALPAPGVYDQPLGHSHAQLLATAATGAVSGTVKMADGITTATVSGFVGPSGQYVLYHGITTITSIHGKLLITPVGVSPSFTDSTLTSAAGITWLRRVQTSTAIRSYRPGFGPLTHTVDGQKYLAPIVADTKNAFGSVPTALGNDMRISFTEAPDIVTAPDTDFRLPLNNVAVMQTLASGFNPATVRLTVTPSTGLVTGTFLQPTAVARTATFSGVILRTGTGAGEALGYFTINRLPDPVGPPITTHLTSPNISGKILVLDPP